MTGRVNACRIHQADCVSSLGAFLLAGGEKGKRFSLPNSDIMIHQPLGGTQGQAEDIRIQAEKIIEIRERINNILSEKTGQPLEKIARDTDRDYHLSAQKAVEYGIIDKVVNSRK